MIFEVESSHSGSLIARYQQALPSRLQYIMNCCLCCAIHYLFLTLYASECCLLYTPVLTVTLRWSSICQGMHCCMDACLPHWVVMHFIVGYGYGLDVSSIFCHQFNPGRIIWKRHLCNISPELQVRVEVLKDMLMYRVDKCQCILTNDELEHIICFRPICTE